MLIALSLTNLIVMSQFHNLFDEALERYNSKQARADRRIDNYYEKIRTSKQEKLFYEVILQIGNKDDMAAVSEECGVETAEWFLEIHN